MNVKYFLMAKEQLESSGNATSNVVFSVLFKLSTTALLAWLVRIVPSQKASIEEVKM